MSFNFLSYMETLARQLVAVSHGVNDRKSFFRVSGISAMEELFQGGLNKGSFPAICAIDQPESRLIDQQSSNLAMLSYYYFFVLQKADVASASSRSQAILESMAIARSILSRMFQEKETACRDSFSVHSGLRNLNRESVSFKAVGPLADNCFGVWVSFTVLSNADIKLNKEDWIPGYGD